MSRVGRQELLWKSAAGVGCWQDKSWYLEAGMTFISDLEGTARKWATEPSGMNLNQPMTDP